MIGSIATRFADQFRAHVRGARAPADRVLVAPIVDIVDGVAIIDQRQATKQPDWTHDPVDSGKAPAERLATASPDAVREPAPAEPVPPPSPSPSGRSRPPGEEGREPSRHHEHPNRVPPEEVAGDPEARLYSSAPIETDEGTVVIEQQNVGIGAEEGGGEWPDPDTPPQPPAPGAA